MNTKKEVYKSIENNEWESVKNFYDLSTGFTRAAEDMIMQTEKFDIVLDKQDINNLKEKAAVAGVQYEVFAASILHQYLSGKLIEK
ncbi:hypothetical protein E4O00_06370 [Treponema sp. OMZ 788]|uniref:hypothetical protein n=1 Tax=unclassified Treponema TaxID=2638727 RepID=UPI0020A47727|nr:MULTISPECIES: hypothetical protein [unclassified Treponema]UTC61330.1 hypothetical protein E4O05_07030 [Treponema sp. OMZ 787]UTC65681.1 hypothetical protein E4O00_06370 [Treponema sp. OMZ 788]